MLGQTDKQIVGKWWNMTEAKHTPGPWTASPNDESSCWVLAGTNNSPLEICDVWATQDLPADANARLIAAAPDGLEFAQFYDAYMTEQFPDGLQKNYDNRTLHPKAAEAWGRCKTFIAKATGA